MGFAKFKSALKSKLAAFIPRHVSNRLVVAVYEILRGWQRLIGPGKQEHASGNEQAFCLHRLRCQDRAGFIEDQKHYTDMHYGRVTMRYAGCEIIAVHNAMRDLKPDYSGDLPDLIRHFERDGMTLGGRFGTAPKAMADYLKAYFEVSMTSRPAYFDAVACVSDGMILTFYNDKENILKEIHTVYVSKDGHGLTGHNVSGDGRIFGPYDTVTDLLEHLNKGRAKGIALIGINRR